MHLDGGEQSSGLRPLREASEEGRLSRRGSREVAVPGDSSYSSSKREGPDSPKGDSFKGTDSSPKRDMSPKQRRAGSAPKLGAATSAPLNGGKPLDRCGSTGSNQPYHEP